MAAVEKNNLRRRRGHFDVPAMRASYDHLLSDVLGIESGASDDGADPSPWTPFALFLPDGGGCVAAVEAAILTLVLDGLETRASGIRSVAVHPDWRGHGLFRDLMEEAVAWIEARSTGPTFLYTEEPALYGRFGFSPLEQHAFAGPAPPRSRFPSQPGRGLDLRDPGDRAIVRALVARRAPVSSQCALRIDAAQFMTNALKDEALVVAHLPSLDMLVVHEWDGRDIVIADIVAPSMPDLTTILGAIGVTPRRVRILFPPDRLAWTGEAVADDTGLMVRGPRPAALARPFMFPPTAEF